MKRRIILASLVTATIAGGACAASAAPHATADPQNHNVCVLIASSNDYGGAKYICVSTPNP
jgi:hypothetical protein